MAQSNSQAVSAQPDPFRTGQWWKESCPSWIHTISGKRPGLVGFASSYSSEGLALCWAHKRLLIKSWYFLTFLYLHPKQTCSSDKRKTGVLQLILSSYQPECHPSSDFQVLLTGFLATRTQLLDVDNSKFPAEADLGQDDCCLLRMWGKKLNNRCLLLSWITIWLVPLSPRPSSKHGTHWL